MGACLKAMVVWCLFGFLSGCSMSEKAERIWEDLPGYAMGILGELMFAKSSDDPGQSAERIQNAAKLYHEFAREAKANPEGAAWRPWPLAPGKLDVSAPARWICARMEPPDNGQSCNGSSVLGAFDARNYASAAGETTSEEASAIWASIKKRFDGASLVYEREALDKSGNRTWSASYEGDGALVEISAKAWEGGFAVGMVSNRDAEQTSEAEMARKEFLAQFSR